jgi:septum formation protein
MTLLIVLASASTRRSRILAECGIPHKVEVSRVVEVLDVLRSPGWNALRNARLKASVVAARFQRGFIIGADTLVRSGNKLIGKPADKAEARRILMSFSGRTISVYTGLWVIDVRRRRSVHALAVSHIRVKRISKAMADRFMKISGPLDKAGGFSIEGPGSFIFDDIRGSFYNILGLPMADLYRLFEDLGVNLMRHCSP